MVLLIVTSVLSSGFGLLVGYARRKDCNLLAVGAVNYATASLFHVVLVLAFGVARPHAATLWIGILGGLVYSFTFQIFVKFMRLRGLSVSAVIMRMSVVIPLFFSLVIWGEEATTMQLVGALFTLFALPFLALASTKTTGKVPARSVLLLVTLFFGVGACALSIRGYHQTAIRGEENLFFTTLFGTAAVVMTLAWLLGKERTSTT